jgi:hypothetical protein
MNKPLKVQSVRDIGPQFTNNYKRMVGQDGAYSIPLNGKTLWFFGDTLIGERNPGESLWYPGGAPVGHYDMSGLGGIEKMINNTGALVTQSSGRYGIHAYEYICDKNGMLKQLVPHLDDEDPEWDRIWCLHGCVANGKVYLYYIKVKMLDDGTFPVNFEPVGSGIAYTSTRQWEFQRVRNDADTIFWNKSQPAFGTVVLRREGDTDLYVYGVRREKTGEQRCYLSRVPEPGIENPGAYEYLKSSKPIWSKNITDAKHIFTGPPNELSVSFNKYLGCYLAVHSMDISGLIVARTAPEPWGPWSEPVNLLKVFVHRTKPLPYPPLVYAAKEHPELAEGDGKVLYITYIEFEEYFPHLIEVTLA